MTSPRYESLGVRWGNRIRAEREARKLTQAECARRVGVGRQFLSTVEGHRQAPSVALLVRLAQEFGCTVDALIEIEGSER